MKTKKSICNNRFFLISCLCFFIVFSFIFTFSMPINVWAKNVYIDPSAVYNGDGTSGKKASGTGQVGAYNTWSSVKFNAADDYYQKCGTTEIGSSNPILYIDNIIAKPENRMIIGAYYLNGDDEVIGLSGERPILKLDAQSGTVVKIVDSDYITIENLDLQRGNTVIYFNNSNYLNFYNNYIGEGSAWGIRSYGNTENLYGTEIHKNVIDSKILIYKQIPETNLWDAIKLVDSANNYKIYNNTIKDFGHTGVSMPGRNTNLTLHNNEIYNNYFDGSNSDHFRGFEMYGAMCAYNKVHHNYIHNMNASSKVEGIMNEVYNNVVDGVAKRGIKGDGIGFILSTRRGDSHHNKIYNNIIYNTASAGVRLMIINVKSDLVGNEITNNILLNTGNDPLDKEKYPIFIADYDDVYMIKNNIFKDNIIYTPGRDADPIKYLKTVKSVNQFNAMSGTDGNTISGNIFDNPMFRDPINGDFSFLPDSPYKDRGIGIGEGVAVGAIESKIDPPKQLTIKSVLQ